MQHGTPLVSIIMPTYNRAGYISETIAYIIAQTYTNWELLVLDDGSSDNTEALVMEVADKRIKYHRFNRTGITGKLKNFGIRQSKGELIAFMDSDDLWPVDKLEKQVAALLEHPEAGFSFTNGFNFTTSFIPEEYFYSQLTGHQVRNMFIDYCTTKVGVRIPTVIFWKYCIDKTGIFNETRLFTDFSFIGQLCYYYKVVILYEPLFYRRLHPGNNFNTNSNDDYFEYFETIEKYIKSGFLKKSTVKNGLFISHIHLGDNYLKNGNLKKSNYHYLNAWVKQPVSFVPLKRIVRSIFIKFKLMK